MSNENTYTIDNIPVMCYVNLAGQHVVPAIKAGVSEKQKLGTTLLGYFCAQEDVMSTKSGFPLNNPLPEKSQLASYLHCPYCTFITKFEGSLERHKSRFHERETASEGERVREGGGKLGRFGTRDYGLPMWECPKCHYRVGPALIKERHQPCRWWGNNCDGILAPVEV